MGLRPRRPRQPRDLVIGFLWLAWGAVYFVGALVSIVRGRVPSGAGVFWGVVYAAVGLSVFYLPRRGAQGWSARRIWLYVATVWQGVNLVIVMLADSAWRGDAAIGIIGAVTFIVIGIYAVIADLLQRRGERLTRS